MSKKQPETLIPEIVDVGLDHMVANQDDALSCVLEALNDPPPKSRSSKALSDAVLYAALDMRATGASIGQINRALNLAHMTLRSMIKRGRESEKKTRARWFADRWDRVAPFTIQACAAVVNEHAQTDPRVAHQVLTSFANGGIGNRVDVNVDAKVSVEIDAKWESYTEEIFQQIEREIATRSGDDGSE